MNAGNSGIRGTGMRCGNAQMAVVESAGGVDLVGFIKRVCAPGPPRERERVVPPGAHPLRQHEDLDQRDVPRRQQDLAARVRAGVRLPPQPSLPEPRRCALAIPPARANGVARSGPHPPLRSTRARRPPRRQGATNARPQDVSSGEPLPIELAWSKVEELARSARARTIDELNADIKAARRTVSAPEAAGWFARRGCLARAT